MTESALRARLATKKEKRATSARDAPAAPSCESTLLEPDAARGATQMAAEREVAAKAKEAMERALAAERAAAAASSQRLSTKAGRRICTSPPNHF